MKESGNSPLFFQNYPPNPGEDYNSWRNRILTADRVLVNQIHKEVGIRETLPPSEGDSRNLFRKWKLPYPIPHTIKYPHSGILSFLCPPSYVTYVGKIEESRVVLEIDCRGNPKTIIDEVRQYISLFAKERKSQLALYENYLEVYDLDKKGLSSKDIAKKVWLKEYVKGEEGFEEEERIMEALIEKYEKQGKGEEAYRLAEREYMENRKTNPLRWRVHNHLRRAKELIENPHKL